jgi:DNA-binding transcriptional ArsR family regulator
MHKFTRIPKVAHLVASGVPVEAIPTYAALADYANNKNGLCWPRMDTLAAGIGRSVRTIQRHLHTLRALGLVEFVQRRRSRRGRFSSYLYRVLAIPGMAASKKSSTTGHRRRVGKPPPIFPGTKQVSNAPSDSPKEGYRWLFGLEPQYLDEEISDEGGQMGLFRLLRGPEGVSQGR